MFLKIKFYANTDIPNYIFSMVAVALQWLGWTVFSETTARTQTLKHLYVGTPLKKFADPQPTQINNSRYGTQRMTEGT